MQKSPAPSIGVFALWVGVMFLWVGMCLALIVVLARFSLVYVKHDPQAWPGCLLLTFGAPTVLTWWAKRRLQRAAKP